MYKRVETFCTRRVTAGNPRKFPAIENLTSAARTNIQRYH